MDARNPAPIDAVSHYLSGFNMFQAFGGAGFLPSAIFQQLSAIRAARSTHAPKFLVSLEGGRS